MGGRRRRPSPFSAAIAIGVDAYGENGDDTTVAA